MNPLSLLGVFAHPDDEGSVGGALARYAAEGVRVTLVIATRGEAATIYCENCATRETLPAVRTQEMERACAILGVRDLRWLDWPDGGINRVDRALGTQRILDILRDVRPQVVITHPPDGGYPHPDHIALWEMTRAAWQTGIGDGLPAKLYHRAIPESHYDLVPALRDYRIQLNGQALPVFVTPDAAISTAIDVSRWYEQRRRAAEAHLSQINPNSVFAGMPDEARQQWSSTDYLVCIASRLTGRETPVVGAGYARCRGGFQTRPYGTPAPTVLPSPREDDLFAGLR